MSTRPAAHSLIDQTLGIIAEVPTYRHAGQLYMSAHIGRIFDELAARYRRTVLCLPIKDGPPPPAADHALQVSDPELVLQPFHASMREVLPQWRAMARAYAKTCRRSDVIFVRSLLTWGSALYAAVWRYRRPICHWLVGDPVRLLLSHRRDNWWQDALGLAYCWQAQEVMRLGRYLVNGVFVCNGDDLARRHPSPRTHAIVSTTLRHDEIHPREDTCTGPIARVLTVSFLRPEKGIEYLVEAFGLLPAAAPAELHLVGSSDRYEAYRTRLEARIAALGLQARVHFHGHVPLGAPLFAELQKADIFVLPTLSEGTPRVLVEARAQGLPVIASNVGGIPTSVRHEYDGLLVPPRDPAALATAIQRLLSDGELRRRLIRNGLNTARSLTLDKFADQIVGWLKT